MSEVKDVHTEHCCLYHGCKYSDASCTVTTRLADQSYPCESCASTEDIVGDVLALRDQILNRWATHTPAELTLAAALQTFLNSRENAK